MVASRCTLSRSASVDDQVLELFFARPESDGFVLAGGAALVATVRIHDTATFRRLVVRSPGDALLVDFAVERLTSHHGDALQRGSSKEWMRVENSSERRPRAVGDGRRPTCRRQLRPGERWS